MIYVPFTKASNTEAVLILRYKFVSDEEISDFKCL